MKIRPILITCLAAIAVTMLFTACGDDGSKLPAFQDKPDTVASFEAAIPYDGQDQVPLSGRVIVYFNQPLNPDTILDDTFTLERLDDKGDASEVGYHKTILPQSVVLVPTQQFTGNTWYRVAVKEGLQTYSGETISLPDREAVTTFRTRGDRPQYAEPPSLVSFAPTSEKVRDFSTFYMYFSEPLDMSSIVADHTVYMQEVESEELVPCHVLKKFSVIVFDPIDDLIPGKTYRIVVTTNVRDLDGTPLKEELVVEVEPTSTSPLHRLVVEACPTAGELSSSCEAMDSEDLPVSRLTGMQVNSMVTFGKVLGESRTYMSGPLFVDLGNSGKPSADLIPVVLRRGQTIMSSNLIALLGGEIPSGLETGEITLTLLTDATGFIEDSLDDGGVAGLRPRVKLMMDASLNAENPKANASFSQQILGVELSGFSVVDPETGVMRMELGGNAEIWVMGERVASLMSMYQVAPDKFPEFVPDTTAPKVMTVTPVDGELLVETETPVVVNLSEPINPATIYDAFKLLDESGAQVEGALSAEGGKIVFVPDAPLEAMHDYTVSVSTGIQDLAGNTLASAFSSTFRSNAQGYDLETGPRIGTTFPANEYGSTLPCNLEPMIFFTADIDPATVIYGNSVSLIDIDSGKLIDVTLDVEYRKILFRPAKYFTPERRYRIVVTNDVMSMGGVRVDTDDDFNPGGRQFELDFITDPYLDAVPLVLHALPSADRNGDHVFDEELEEETPINSITIQSILIEGSSYVQGDMVSLVHGLSKTADGQVYLDIDLSNGIRLFATSVSLDIEALLDFLEEFIEFEKDDFNPLDLLDMGAITIDVIAPGKAPIIYNEFDFVAEMAVNMDTYFSVANGLFNALLTHELPLSQTGRLSFAEDGRMEVIITGVSEIEMLKLLKMPSLISMRTMSDPSL